MERWIQWMAAAYVAAVIFLTVAMNVGAQAIDDVLDKADTPTPLENWQVISALALPLVMAVIIQSKWSRGARAAATMAVSVLWTFIVKLLSDDSVIVPQIIIQALELFALAIPFYYGLYKPSGIAPAIEAKTTL